MRLRRLHLKRYGGFADAVLDLPRPDGSDVTVVLGPNETGKSTAFGAWLDLLFGIPVRNSPAAWRFPRNELAVAADLETARGPVDLHRLPTARDALRDADGSSVPEGEVAVLVHGLDRDGYRTRFSLDREMLEKGGRDIASARGDLGDLLFAGMAGLPGIQAALEATKAEADAFHRLGGRRTKTTGLGAGMAALKEAEPALKARLTPEAQARHDESVNRAEAAQREAGIALAQARRALACEQDAVALREIDRRLTAQDEELAGLPDCSWTPEEAEDARRAQAEAERTAKAVEDAEAALKQAKDALAGRAAEPGEGLAAAAIDALERLRVDDASVLSRLGPDNDEDLRRITGRRETARQALGAARARFGLDGPAKGLVDRIEPALRAAGDAAAAATRAAIEARTAEADLAELPAPRDVGDVARLRRTLDALDRLDLLGLRADRDAKAEALERLGPVAPATETLPDPSHLRAAIARYWEAAAAQDAALKAQREAWTAMDVRRRAAEAARREDAGADASAVEAARQARDVAWQNHRAALDAETADMFADAMSAHDRLVAGLATAATRAETARGAQAALAEAEALHDARAAEAKRAADALAAQDLTGFARALGLFGDAPPDALPDRLDVLREHSRATPAAARAEEALAEAEKSRRRLLAELRTLLPEAQDPEAAARTCLHDAEAASEAKGRHDTAKAHLARARRYETETGIAAQEAARRLDQDRTALGLGPVTLSDLPALRKLETAESKDADDARRQSALLRAREAAGPQLARLREIGAPDDDPVTWARARAADDRAAVQARDTATRLRDEAASALEDGQRAAAQAAAARDAFLAGQGGEVAPAQRVARLSLAARQVAERATTRREAEAIEARHDPDMLSAARALPPDPARIGALEDAVDAAEAVHRDAIARAHDARRARDEAQGGEVAALATQARALALEELREGASRAAAALLGYRAGRAALARLVEENKGPMVAAASEAFARITCGEWDGLEVFGPDGTMTLWARKGDARAPVDGLSEGARAQLFLALRVAGHAAFCDRSGPLPFVTDDILEAFDDTRADAALRMAGEMGRRGQVVFFTHHDHIAALARDAIPGVSVVAMPRQGR